jgi:hypothetical protein
MNPTSPDSIESCRESETDRCERLEDPAQAPWLVLALARVGRDRF